jgi:acyl-lipid omega-6 desaturase (Delta-12 desaturase)
MTVSPDPPAAIDHLRQQMRSMVERHNKSNNITGFSQVLSTLACFALLWWIALLSADNFRWICAAATALVILFTLRVFALMHECGHGSLFRTPWLNRASGFVLGVVTGMPQYVWSQHHAYHHAHNGNWDMYRGPYTTPSTDEYAAMSAAQQWMYRFKCSIPAAPLVGFVYLIFNPRYTWAKGSLGLLWHVLHSKLRQPRVFLKQHAASYKTRYWKSAREYWHMFFNNVVLLSLWSVMCVAVGTLHFFVIYLITLSIAGAAGVILFTVQHNFEHAYASDSEHWDYATGAIRGTSFLLLPRWLNWFTADIGYHHIHHLSAKIPNYCLASCHNEYEHLFAGVTRIRPSEFRNALKYILWDKRTQRIISVAEYRRQLQKHSRRAMA